MSRPWWHGAVVYQVYIRSFADADGDGVGDLPGIRSRLPYLAGLGVDAIWITPFYPSPMADGGYDVADYRDVDPLFGTLADADALVPAAHDLGLRVVVDIVPNHTSDRHPWFQRALAAGPGSPERDRYVFRPGRGPDGSRPPTNWQAAFGGSAWQRVPDGEWYLHLYAPEQPDLNWENPEVVEEFRSVLRFWLDRGVDGFRVDAATVLRKDQRFPDREQPAFHHGEGPDHPYRDRDEIHQVYRGWREVLNGYRGDRMMIGECWVRDPERLARYLRPDEMHAVFNFQFLRAPWSAARMREIVAEVLGIGAAGSGPGAAGSAPCTWVLANHDVTRQATRYGRLDTTAGGVEAGDRVEPATPVDPVAGLRRARAAALLLLALPGSAYLYQGEELGLPEVVDLPEDALRDPIWERKGHTDRGRDGCRVPVPWTPDGPSYGFGPAGSWLPQPPAWAALSVAAQAGVPGSTLELYRAALRIRATHPALGAGTPGTGVPGAGARGAAAPGAGTLSWVDGPEDTLAFDREPGFRLMVNFGRRPVPLPPHRAVLLASEPGVPTDRLPPDTAVWLSTGA